MNPVFSTIALISAMGIFAVSLWRRLRPMTTARSPEELSSFWPRLWRFLTVGLGQRKLFRFALAGIAHSVIFWGFLVLLCNTIIIIGRGFDTDFALGVLHFTSPLGRAYSVLRDGAVQAVWVMALGLLITRLVVRPRRLVLSREGAGILLLILAMMTCDMIYWESIDEASSAGWMGKWLVEYSPGWFNRHLREVGEWAFWGHFSLVLVFLNLLPMGKHFHVITALPNVAMGKMLPSGRLPGDRAVEAAMADDDADDAAMEAFGIARMPHFTWKDMLEFYSCTECGRCNVHCPAVQVNKSLAPRELMLSLRNGVTDSLTDIVPHHLSSAVIWDCFTCMACEVECPVDNRFVDKIVGLRRQLVEEKGDIPPTWARVLRGMENNSNPWNRAQGDRSQWGSGLDIPAFDAEKHEYLLFVGCAASYDERGQKIAQALIQLLKMADVSFGTLGANEICCGETARRMGSESTFLEMREALAERILNSGAHQVLTVCPHCFNTLLNEYPQIAHVTITHHVSVLEALLAQRRLNITTASTTMVYHDPCYLGRYNREYAGHRLIERLGTVSTIPRTKDAAMCCGGGGGHFYTEDNELQRVNLARVSQLEAASADIVCTACPYCATMLADGLQGRDRAPSDGPIQMDVAQALLTQCRPGQGTETT